MTNNNHPFSKGVPIRVPIIRGGMNPFGNPIVSTRFQEPKYKDEELNEFIKSVELLNPVYIMFRRKKFQRTYGEKGEIVAPEQHAERHDSATYMGVVLAKSPYPIEDEILNAIKDNVKEGDMIVFNPMAPSCVDPEKFSDVFIMSIIDIWCRIKYQEGHDHQCGTR